MSGYRESVVSNTVTIANGQTTSGAVDLGVSAIVGIALPATMTGTALTFTVSNDDSTYQALRDSTTNTDVTLTFTQGKSYAIDPSLFWGYRYLKVVSNATEGGARTITINSRVAA